MTGEKKKRRGGNPWGPGQVAKLHLNDNEIPVRKLNKKNSKYFSTQKQYFRDII